MHRGIWFMIQSLKLLFLFQILSHNFGGRFKTKTGTESYMVEGYMVHLPLYMALMNAGPSADCCSA